MDLKSLWNPSGRPVKFMPRVAFRTPAMSNQDPAVQAAPLINLFCCEERDGWRVYLRPTWLPRYLAQHFDEFDEAYPVYLDFEELDRRMRKGGLEYDKRVSTRGDVELTATGPAATELATWLSTGFASVMR
jgi:hypothetical protein